MSELAIKTKECVHYWVIESPNGSTSKGWCKYCGITVVFFNDLQVNMEKYKCPLPNDVDDKE
jgi:hypothetical protein